MADGAIHEAATQCAGAATRVAGTEGNPAITAYRGTGREAVANEDTHPQVGDAAV